MPPGTVHTLANRSGATAVVRNTHTPASGFDEFVAHGDRLVRARGITAARDIRFPILFSMLTLEYPRTLRPGRRRDEIVTRGLAGIGRLLRMSTRVDRA